MIRATGTKYCGTSADVYSSVCLPAVWLLSSQLESRLVSAGAWTVALHQKDSETPTATASSHSSDTVLDFIRRRYLPNDASVRNPRAQTPTVPHSLSSV